MTLSNVQVGDYITIRSRSSVRITRVARVTKVKQVVVGSNPTPGTEGCALEQEQQ